jgi:hypothetical protein
VRVQLYEARGLEVPVELWGSAADTLVFLPGLGCHPRYYRRGLERLARRFRIVVPDLSFRTHSHLPSDPDEYLAVVDDVAGGLAPGAVWSGHSFGALLALLRPGPAIACAPSIPADIPLWRTVSRAAWLQLREYAGLEGRLGPAYAGRILTDYVSTAVVRPDALFPAVVSLKRPPAELPIRTGRAVVYLCARDEMYRASEYGRYLAACGHEGVTIETLGDGHDWPILRPARFAERVERAWERLGTS